MSTLIIDIPSYLAKTMDWETTDHGAYLLLLTHYRVTGPFTERVTTMARIIRGEEGDWRMCRERLSRMFSIDDNGVWHHADMDELIAKAGRAKDKATKASRAAHAAAPKPTTLAVQELAASDDTPDVMKHFQIEAPPIRTAPPPPEPDPMGTLIDVEFTLTGEEILRCSAECPEMETDDLASMLDSFKRYHIAAGTLSTDWDDSWRRWWERKKPQPAKPSRAKPRIEVSRRAEQADG